MVLSEPRGLLLFQAVRGGIESVWVFGRRPRPITPRILTLDPIRSEHTDDERSNLSCCRRIAQNGYVVQFSFLGSNVSPFFPDSQHDGGNLASQRQACHLRTHTPLLKILQVGAVGFALTAAGRRTDEHFFQTTITIAIQSASGHRFPATYDAAFFHLVLGTHVCDHSQAAVTPELLPGPKAMWRIHRGNDQGASNRSQLWNGSQQGEGPVAPALHQHRLFSSLSQ